MRRVLLWLLALGVLAVLIATHQPDPEVARREWAALDACLAQAHNETQRYLCWYAPGIHVE